MRIKASGIGEALGPMPALFPFAASLASAPSPKAQPMMSAPAPAADAIRKLRREDGGVSLFESIAAYMVHSPQPSMREASWMAARILI